MTLSVDQKQLVQATWLKILPIADTAAKLFYQHLFELDPSLKNIFSHTDMNEQRLKLIQMLTAAVNGLDAVEELVPSLEVLGRKHVGYGVKDAHYAAVGEALLWTLGKGLGTLYTAKVAEAWSETYSLVAGVMRRAAREVPALQPA